VSNKIIKNNHDHFFKSMMLEPKVIKELFECHLPTHIKSIINFDTIKPEKDSFITDELDERLSDMLVSVEFNGAPGYIYVLIEHQSKPEKLMPFRILKYLLSIWDLHLKTTKKQSLPAIYPLIFYSGFKKYNYSTCFFDLFDDRKLIKDILCNPYQLIDLSKISDKELMSQPWYGMFASVMKHSHDKNVIKFLKQITEALQPMVKLGGINYIYGILRYIIGTYDVAERDFVKAVKTNLPFIEEEKVMTIAEQYRQKGMQQGMQQGKIEALEAVATNLLKQNMSEHKVSTLTGLSIFYIKKLKKKLKIKTAN